MIWKVRIIGINRFPVKGERQKFESSFNCVLEDWHNVLQKGYAITDTGAPEGDFSFKLNVKKDKDNSTLNLILFEASAKTATNI